VGIVTRAVKAFMDKTDKLKVLFGPANRGDTAAPVVHHHDDFEHASEDDLAGFEVETDSHGHHYAVRKTDLWKEEI
jgi:hypothetical protein